MKEQRQKARLGFVFGGVWLLLGRAEAVRTQAFLSEAVLVTGHIESIDFGNYGRKSRPITIVYLDRSDRPHKLVIHEGRSPGRPRQVGDPVEIAYSPDHPDDARIVSNTGIWMWAMVGLTLGAVGLVYGYAKWPRPPEPEPPNPDRMA